jgi:PBSX family phage terminase large subunit
MAISHKQKQIMAFPFTDYDAIICDGAIRSGKTVFMMLSFVDDAMRRYNHQRFGICGKTVDSTVKNIISPYLALGYAQDKYQLSWRRTDKLLIVSDGEKENIFEVFGGKDESSFMLIQGRTLAGVLLDEVALMPRSFVEQALARCSVDGSKMWFNCNPDSPDHWFYKDWVSCPEKHNAIRLRFSLEDNPSLSEKIIERYKTMYSGVFYNRYILGEWCVAEGAIYRAFLENENRFYISADEVPKGDISYICIGQDFGGHKSKHTFCATGISADYQRIYVLRSEEYDATGTSVDFVVEALDTLCKDIQRRYGFVDYVFSDSAEQTIINTERQRLGWSIRNSVKNEIIDRIRCEDILFTSNRIKIVKDENESLIVALKSAVWDLDAKEDKRLDNPGVTNICPLDAFEYSWEYWINRLSGV